MKNLLKRAAALALAACLMISSAAAASSTVSFSDVPNEQGMNAFIMRAARENLIAGIGDGKFGVGTKVTNAQFATMLVNLFYKDELKNYSNSTNYWWYPYMNAAYTEGILDNTVMGESRQTAQGWSPSVVNASINRYDMAQMMINVAKRQGWPLPTDLEKLIVQLQIGDWSSIPEKYKSAVAVAYAKGFLSGQDEKGTFGGTQNMLREQGAVVLCHLFDAKKENAYSNTTNLVNGKTVTADNVKAAVAALKESYPTGTAWGTTASYTSMVLGRAAGKSAFTYMLSDQVFGTFLEKTVDQDDLKVGDLIFLTEPNAYVLVEEVNGNSFYYACVDSSGLVSWDNRYYISDLDRDNTVRSRYGNNASSGSISETQVKRDLNDLKTDKSYGDGLRWTDSSYAYATGLCKQVFGNVNPTTHTDIGSIKVGDILRYGASKDDDYRVILSISGSTLTYATVKDKYTDWTGTMKTSDFSSNAGDLIYTYYSASNSSESQIKSDLNDLKSDRTYGDGQRWSDSTYAFATELCEKVFGRVSPTTHTNINNIKVGDILRYGESKNDDYRVILSISGSTLTYATVKDKYTDWTGTMKTSDFSSNAGDLIYTYYSASGSSESQVKSDLNSFKSDRTYGDGQRWSDTDYAFATELCKKVFGNVNPTTHTNINSIKVGDILRYGSSSDDDYRVILSISGSTLTYATVEDRYIDWTGTMKTSDFSSSAGDLIYTYYSASGSSESQVKSDLNSFKSDRTYGDGQRWSDTDYAFATELCKKVFGNVNPTTHTNINSIKVGDILRYGSSSDDDYRVILSISGSTLTYATVVDRYIDWTGTMKTSDFSSSAGDLIYTYYSGTTSSGNAESRVKSDLNALKSDRTYGDGQRWSDTNYAFATELCKKVFGNVNPTTHTNINSIKVGDILRYGNSSDDNYRVILSISGSTLTYATVVDRYIDWTGTMKTSDFSSSAGDLIYTYYNASGTSESQVKSDLNSFKSDRTYGDGQRWSDTDYAFATELCKKVFGNVNPTTHTNINNIKVGDILRYGNSSDDDYRVILSISGSTLTYATVVDRYIDWTGTMQTSSFSSSAGDLIYSYYNN